MIIAVPEQVTVPASSAGIPEHQVVLTYFRWWCSACRTGSLANKWSHADLTLRMADLHAKREQCHAEGQLALFALAGAP